MTNSVDIVDEDSNTVIVRDGIEVVFNARGGIDVYGNVPVTLHAPVNDTARPQAQSAPQVGDRMEDGTIYAGISPDTGKPMYTTPADAPLNTWSNTITAAVANLLRPHHHPFYELSWKQAMKYATELGAHRHKDWRIPNEAELEVLFNNRASIKGFEDGCYWSSSEYVPNHALIQRFRDGSQYPASKPSFHLVRCVR